MCKFVRSIALKEKTMRFSLLGIQGLVIIPNPTPCELFFPQLLLILDSWLMKRDPRSKQQMML